MNLNKLYEKKIFIIILVVLVIYKIIFYQSFFIYLAILGYLFLGIYLKTKNKVLKNILNVGIIIGVSIFCFSLGTIINDIISNNKENNIKNNYVIILGGSLKKDKPKASLRARLDRGYEYYKEHPNTIFVVTGGQGTDEEISESRAMKIYLEEKGIPSFNIIEEDKSTSTYENLKYSKAFIPEGEEIGIITNDYHVYRTKKVGAKQNLSLNGIYAKTPLWSLVSGYTRESIALVYYKMFGKI